MRFVVYGAGAIGGVVGARLFQHDHEVILIARRDHYRAIRDDGLRIQDPTGEATLPIPVVDHPRRVEWRGDDVALVAVKSQQTEAVLTELATVAPPELAVVCLQNGVRNEPEALRRFPNVYAVPVASPTAHLEPGVVQAYSSPVTGILDIGRYPEGVDDVALDVSAAFAASTFDSQAIPDVFRWKWRKLITNLGNAVEAVCGPEARGGIIGQRAAEEGEACLEAAGIDAATTEEDRARRRDLLKLSPIGDQRRPGGSSWQSLARGAPDIESDYLNGEVVLLGRLHGVPTPVNQLLQRLANQLAATGAKPGSVSPDRLEELLASA
ncbi:MAG TPA: 2-dehydropantoate 2-reductase [Acidimicrobiales bacterium]|jgi:2-dehydropantoate 2-reductase|nr:2-dehydropantoate 2-reductase [Acidimicrobiales bacterium]